MRSKKSFDRAILASIWKYSDKAIGACGHDEFLSMAEKYLAYKTLPLIEEAMRVAHEAGASGISWQQWSTARKNLAVTAQSPAEDDLSGHAPSR